MDRIIIAAITGALVMVISMLISSNKMKKTLAQCEVSGPGPANFEYKGKYYDKESFIQIRTSEYIKTTVSDLAKQIKNDEKTLANGENSIMFLLELEAKKRALEFKNSPRK